jgi:hypothetical protein
MMTDGTMDHDGMITDGTMNNEMPQRGITPGDAGGHAGHHPDGSPQSVGS